MKKKFLEKCLWGLAFFLVCISGCKEKTMIGSGSETEHSKTMEEILNEEDIIPTASPDAQIPEDGIYETCKYLDKCISGYSDTLSIIFYVMSQEELPEEMEIIIDTSIPYEYRIMKVDLATDPIYQISSTSFRSYLYSCYRNNMDWVQLNELQIATEEAMERYEEAKEKFEKEEMEKEEFLAVEEEYGRIVSECTKLSTKNGDDYHGFLELVDEDTLDFCCYEIHITFDVYSSTNFGLEKPQTITSMELKAGDWSQTIETGNIAIYYYDPENVDLPFSYSVSRTGMSQRIGGYSLTGQEYVDRAIQCTTEENIILKRAYFFNDSETTIDKMNVEIETGGSTMSVPWELGTDLLIRQGETFRIELLFSDEKMKEYQYSGNKIFCLEYELDGELYTIIEEISIFSGSPPLREIYAEVFHGVDVDGYYNGYYVPLKERELQKIIQERFQ